MITVDAEDGQSVASIKRLVLGPGFRSLLAQQGHLVLHASAVSVQNEAAVFLGPSGSGKSTLAAALAAAGHTFLTDDIVPVRETNEGYATFAGPPGVWIRPTVAEQLGYDTATRCGATTDDTREQITISVEERDEEIPIAKLYFLEWADNPTIDDPTTVDIVPELLHNSYPIPGDRDTTAFDEQFRRCMQFLDAVPVRRLRRPKSLPKLADTVSMVETDLMA